MCCDSCLVSILNPRPDWILHWSFSTLVIEIVPVGGDILSKRDSFFSTEVLTLDFLRSDLCDADVLNYENDGKSIVSAPKLYVQRCRAVCTRTSFRRVDVSAAACFVLGFVVLPE